MVQVQSLGTDTRYGLKILHQCANRVETKSEKKSFMKVCIPFISLFEVPRQSVKIKS